MPEERKISPAVIFIPVGLGLGLAAAVAVYALARAAAGFSLSLTNVPGGAVLWSANFAEKSFEYDPIADSGWLSVDESWVYPSDPRGVTTLHILILDAENNVLLDVYNLGPVIQGEDYTYDCLTGVLYWNEAI